MCHTGRIEPNNTSGLKVTIIEKHFVSEQQKQVLNVHFDSLGIVLVIRPFQISNRFVVIDRIRCHPVSERNVAIGQSVGLSIVIDSFAFRKHGAYRERIRTIASNCIWHKDIIESKLNITVTRIGIALMQPLHLPVFFSDVKRLGLALVVFGIFDMRVRGSEIDGKNKLGSAGRLQQFRNYHIANAIRLEYDTVKSLFNHV